MAGPAPNNYDFWADDNDRNYYNSLTTNVERVAFIRCIWTMMNPRTEPLKRKRPRSGKGRLKKWWERRSNKLKEATDEDRAGTLPLADPFVPAERPGSEGSRSPESEVDIERPSKRRRMSIGGGLSLPFIYHNDPTQNHYIPPTRTAREHIDGASEGERWRFATVLKQVNTNIPQADHRYGTSPKSLYLFVRVDTDDIIREQRVVKAFDTSFADIWTAQDFGKTFDEENTIREALSTTDCPHLVRYYNTSDQEQQFTIENAIDGQMAMNADNVARANWNHQFIYSEYAPHKTLRELINAVQSPDPPEPIPEHFILYVFARLLSALVALKAQRILHLVIKPENIFFGDPDERDATYPGYKRVMLGDFESAVQMVEDSEDHPNLPNDAPIALPWPPPELSHREDRGFNPSVNWRLSEKTDIYSLGLVIREMMICSTTTRAELDALRNRETGEYPDRHASKLPPYLSPKNFAYANSSP
ncbi:hypothetical protein CC80DRAFT_269699 [Byssothecium circinans]|uniref:Protein kinase domain-containing protein n=1 Tax=Byssothecium circinans TaxID=147558 RepID=A0A6A5U799_9PLEO|nr:hypothetical protein CC80DRAFT_269699 [Byssothecium circinans]